MKIRFKILAGFIVIIVMLLTAGIMSVFEFTRLSDSINGIVNDNYRSIHASKDMIESLEREDSGVLMYISGEKTEGRSILFSSDSVFRNALDIAQNNITESGEDTVIEQIIKLYENYFSLWNKNLFEDSVEIQMNTYYTGLHLYFQKVKTKVNELHYLNQSGLYNRAGMLQDKATRALMPGIVAIITALLLILIFNFLISYYFVNPLKNLIRAISHYYPSSKKEFTAHIESNDELKELENEIQNLITRLRSR